MAQGSLRSVAEEHLLTLLQMVNEWLRFAETKNAGLLAFSGLSVTAVLSFTAQVDEFESKWGAGFLVFGSALWLVSAVITALSFVPKTDLLNIVSRLDDPPEESDNLYYYRHLAKYNAQDLLENLGVPKDNVSPRYRFEKYLAQQVITNSRITNSKLVAFQWATKAWILGLVGVTIGTILTFGARG